MATPRQIAANRLNSQKSTGPRSEAGKLVSRTNAIRSGLYAESPVIRGEDPDGLDRLTAEYYAEFQPSTPRQRDLIDTLVHNQWLTRRLRRIETSLWERHFALADDTFSPDNNFSVLNRQHPLGGAFGYLAPNLDRLQRRLNSLERSTQRCLAELRSLIKAADARPEPETIPAATEVPATEPTSPQIGFVPSNRPSAPPDPPAPPASSPWPPAPVAQARYHIR